MERNTVKDRLIAYLSEKKITTEGGHIYITRSRQKTGVQYRTMLLKPAAAILAKIAAALGKRVDIVD